MSPDVTMARSELANAARKARRNPDDLDAAAAVVRKRGEYFATKMAVQIRTGLDVVQDLDVWAGRVASTLAARPAAAQRLAAALAEQVAA